MLYFRRKTAESAGMPLPSVDFCDVEGVRGEATENRKQAMSSLSENLWAK